MNAHESSQDDALDDLKLLLRHLLAAPAEGLASLTKAFETESQSYSLGHVAHLFSIHLAMNEPDSFASASEMVHLVGFVADDGYDIDDALRWLRSVADEADIVPSEEDWERITTHLRSFLSPNGYLNLISKARAALLNLPRLFTEVSVASDVGAVFVDEQSDVPEISIVSHRFKIWYLDGKRRRSFTVTLDTGDLRKLYETVETALKRDKHLRLCASKGKTPCFEIS